MSIEMVVATAGGDRNSKVMKSGSTTQQNGTSEEEPFVFERSQFNRPDFNVERFIYLASKRASMSQVHTDLRGYLRQLQNSMVELINDEYADFVNLSSNLAVLKESITKLTTNVNSAWDTFESSTSKIRQTVELVNQKSVEIAESRQRQIGTRNKISLLLSVERLAACLSHPPSDLSSKWYTKLIHAVTAVEHWQSRIVETEIPPRAIVAKESCVEKAKGLIMNDLIADLRSECRCVGLIFTVLEMFGQRELAVKKIADVVVRQSMETSERDDIRKLNCIYEQVMRLRKRWIHNCEIENQLTPEVHRFLEDGLLKYVLDYLDEQLAVLCIPSDPAIFFQSYNLTDGFVQRFPQIDEHPDFLRGLTNRYNVDLYVKRVSNPLIDEVLARTANSTITWNDDSTVRHPLEVSSSILTAFERMFDVDVFLPVVADRTWEFCIQLINKHTEWIDYCLAAEPTRNVDEISGVITTVDRWPDLVGLLAGSQQFDSQLFDLCLKVVFGRLEQLGADSHGFRQFLSEYKGKMETKHNQIRQLILNQLVESASKPLQTGVADIPKRYRWTKRPTPTEASPYVDEAMEVHGKFGEIATLRSWSPEMIMEISVQVLSGMIDLFLQGAQQVLNSVQLTGSSLQRFKRKGTADSAANTDTDESKIRRQLLLDTQKLHEHASVTGASTEKVDEFLFKMTTWADIQRLAADLQRVQSTDSAKKLSEMNCVEIISNLIETGKINVVVTANGKEYVTKKHLVTEVQNECLAANGRVNLTDLVPILRVELDHIDAAASTLAADQPDDFVLCAGDLVSRDYINGLCKRINERLQECGQISMYQLAKNWEVPTELLNHYVLTELGNRIDATRLEDQIYTRHFYRLQQNKLRAALVALTKPTILSSIFSSFEIPQSLFFNVWNELTERGQLNGHLIGSKGSLKSVYVPRMHDLLVRSYVKNAFLTNDFVETSTLRKLSIIDTHSYFRDLLPKEKVKDCVFLQSGVVSSDLWKQAIGAVEDRVIADLFCVVDSALPNALINLSTADLESLVTAVKKNRPSWSVVQNGDESPIIFDARLVEKTIESLEPFLQERAQTEAPKVAERIKELRLQQQNKKCAEDKKTANDDDDWGTGSGKKKGKGGKKGAAAKSKAPTSSQTSSQSDYATVVSLDASIVIEELKRFVEVPNSLFDELADLVAQPASARYRTLIESQLNAVDSTDTKDQRRSHEEKRQRVQSIYEQICVFESGLSDLPESLAADLHAYLQRSLISDFCAHTLAVFADTPTDPTALNSKQRDELIATISEQSIRNSLTELFASQRSDLSAFHDSVRSLQTDCSFLIRQPDKRRRIEVVAEHLESLREKLNSQATDAPTALLLLVILFVTTRHPNPDSSIHVSGKFVAPLIRYLAKIEEPKLSSEIICLLNDCQKLVVESVKQKTADPELNNKLQSKLDQLKKHVPA
ncbi:Component of oligomeric Golgi complex 2 [Aphelenchoides besseyi]|nr:Component of oligomeric Golgi complex 2 [Aphelenchoides besseyi]KAI6211958.1 Component of oligomeric Golgi complex 2 [Aphelenchoides besseyi]